MKSVLKIKYGRGGSILKVRRELVDINRRESIKKKDLDF